MTLDIKSISFGLSRGLSDVCQFNRETIEVLLTSIDRIYKRILDDLIKTGVSTLFKILRGSILFNVVKEIYFRIYHSYRCTWGKS